MWLWKILSNLFSINVGLIFILYFNVVFVIRRQGVVLLGKGSRLDLDLGFGIGVGWARVGGGMVVVKDLLVLGEGDGW